MTDRQVLQEIRGVRSENCGVYGVRKVHAELVRRGHRVAKCTVARLMRSDGLRGISRAKGPRTTIPGTGPDTRPDLLDRNFTATAPDRVWVADIERHEALLNRVEVGDLHRCAVAAAW